MAHKMTLNEIERYRERLVELTKKLPEKLEDPLPEGLKPNLLDIAREIGACTRSVHIKDRDVYNASIEDLISNIHQALNTATMIEMCRISARNFWVAVIASIIAFISVFIGSTISLLSMATIWVAALLAK
jgi:hypothetical protein